MVWTKAQQILVAILPKFSSSLSMFGSIWIIIEVLTGHNKGKRKLHHSYHRLLLAMSFYDVLENGWNFASSWPIPEGTKGIIWAQGTAVTCSAQGFFLTLSVAVPIYNAMLSLYYLSIIVYKLTDETLRKRIEPGMHIIAFSFAFGTAFWSAMTGLFNNANLWCWIAPYPSDCKDSWRYGEDGDCERGDNAWIYQWGFYFAPLWFCIFTATICTMLVYRHIRSIEKMSLKYRRPELYLSSEASAFNTRQMGISQVDFKASNDKNKSPLMDEVLETSAEGSQHRTDSVVLQLREQNNAPSELECEIKVSINELPCDDPTVEIAESEKSEENTGGKSESRRQTSKVRKAVKKWQSTRDRYRDEYHHSVEVYHQALYYLGAFYLTHVWSTSNRMVQFANQGESFFVLTAIHSFFDPLQGFLNYLVYQRPRYIHIRKGYPNAGRIGAIYRMVRFSFMLDPNTWGDRVFTSVKMTNGGSIADNAKSLVHGSRNSTSNET